jgi:hypothetical protein
LVERLVTENLEAAFLHGVVIGVDDGDHGGSPSGEQGVADRAGSDSRSLEPRPDH